MIPIGADGEQSGRKPNKPGKALVELSSHDSHESFCIKSTIREGKDASKGFSNSYPMHLPTVADSAWRVTAAYET